ARRDHDGTLRHPAGRDRCYRKDDSVTAIGARVGDADEYSDPNAMLSLLEQADLRSLAYTSFSRRSEQPKYRIVLPLARLVTREEYPAVLRGFCALYGGGHLDPQCKDLSRAFYLPSTP